MTYTPLHFLEDVRGYVAQHNQHLTPEERQAIMTVPIHYKALAQENAAYILDHAFNAPIGKRDFLMGATDKKEYDGMIGARAVHIFGCDHLRDQEEMAKSIVHELAHVITPNGGHGDSHGDIWAANARKLGLNEIEESYHGDQKLGMKSPGHISGPWTDTELADFVHSLPQVEWGDLDHDAAVCYQEAVERMIREGL